MPGGGPASGDGVALRRPSVGFAAICLGYFAIILDGSVLNVAVPAIRAHLHCSLASAQWVLNAYTLTGSRRSANCVPDWPLAAGSTTL
jgi:MFS transporter, DHA2 family, methylenomycin A resistance protein